MVHKVLLKEKKSPDRKTPGRPHWMGMYKKAEAARDRLEARVAELDGMEGRCHSMENEIQELLEDAEAVATASLRDKLNVALDEIAFLRGVITEVTLSDFEAKQD